MVSVSVGFHLTILSEFWGPLLTPVYGGAIRIQTRFETAANSECGGAAQKRVFLALPHGVISSPVDMSDKCTVSNHPGLCAIPGLPIPFAGTSLERWQPVLCQYLVIDLGALLNGRVAPEVVRAVKPRGVAGNGNRTASASYLEC